jgi:K+-transporting ATPase A subunit
MNLFNPKGQRSLGVAQSSMYRVTTTDETDRSVDKIRSIFNDQGGKGKIRNVDLQKKTEAV